MRGEIVRLAGIERVNYKDKQTGNPESFTRLHLIYAEGEVDGVEGCKVEQIFCPREVNEKALVIGAAYETEYRIRDGKGGKTVVLVGLDRLDDEGPERKSA